METLVAPETRRHVPPPPAIRPLPQPLEIIPSIPGVRTFVPYYDTEDDVLQRERQAGRQQRRQARQEERAFLPRDPWTGKVIRPGPAVVDPLPSGARLGSLRAESAFG